MTSVNNYFHFFFSSLHAVYVNVFILCESFEDIWTNLQSDSLESDFFSAGYINTPLPVYESVNELIPIDSFKNADSFRNELKNYKVFMIQWIIPLINFFQTHWFIRHWDTSVCCLESQNNSFGCGFWNYFHSYLNLISYLVIALSVILL